MRGKNIEMTERYLLETSYLSILAIFSAVKIEDSSIGDLFFW